ncbi:hypothetical protein QJS10_CPA16g01113 [Acorus calamus]|uniref:TPX2 C-terminal domain-containing protein n=1 Tax=Acorus calamus TaxID=4465 RepID=A0AAV9D064_ACOCL|nr:hypothetical protein QJS10_CPA16g01113 [Acorus calamus]
MEQSQKVEMEKLLQKERIFLIVRTEEEEDFLVDLKGTRDLKKRRETENQEAEIKQLRKSLTFKAKPMPSFYKEPAPPKIELKKVNYLLYSIYPPHFCGLPNTSALDASEGDKSGRSSRSSLNTVKPNGIALNGNGNSITSEKKPLQKSLSKLPSKKPVT